MNQIQDPTWMLGSEIMIEQCDHFCCCCPSRMMLMMLMSLPDIRCEQPTKQLQRAQLFFYHGCSSFFIREEPAYTYEYCSMPCRPLYLLCHSCDFDMLVSVGGWWWLCSRGAPEIRHSPLKEKRSSLPLRSDPTPLEDRTLATFATPLVQIVYDRQRW